MRRGLLPLFVSLALHAALVLIVARRAARRPPARNESVSAQVVYAPPPAPPPPPKIEPPPPAPRKVARTPPPKALNQPPPPPPRAVLPPPVSSAPPPPTKEAPAPAQAPIVTGITLESTSEGGTMSVQTGNTFGGNDRGQAVAPRDVHPYKAAQYASSAQVTELPQLRNREALNLRKYYPAEAKRNDFEGDVVLRLLVDSDGRVVKADVVSDPGQGLGRAAVQAALKELLFTPPRVNGEPVATTIPFTMHFTLD